MHFWGMHLFWWILWTALLVWIFALPWEIPGERRPRENAIEILKRRYAEGEISTEEFEERKRTLGEAAAERSDDHA